MNCEKCHSIPATVHCTSIENGKSREIHLCAKCASGKEFGVPLNFGMTLGQILEPILKGVTKSVKTVPKGVAGASQKKCPTCGVTWREISERRRLNCSMDYEVFANEIEEILREYHRAGTHVGKRPGMNPEERQAMDATAKKTPEHDAREEEIKRLTKELDAVVKTENYEKAAEIRDRIKALEKPSRPPELQSPSPPPPPSQEK